MPSIQVGLMMTQNHQFWGVSPNFSWETQMGSTRSNSNPLLRKPVSPGVLLWSESPPAPAGSIPVTAGWTHLNLRMDPKHNPWWFSQKIVRIYGSPSPIELWICRGIIIILICSHQYLMVGPWQKWLGSIFLALQLWDSSMKYGFVWTN